MLLNIHTHNSSPNETGIINILKDFENVPATGYYSAGIHPWYISKESWRAAFQSLKALVQQRHILAVGECGLDTVCETDYSLQQDCFREQIRLANSVNKPLLIHCVKAYENTMHLLTAVPVRVPVIFHGFNKNAGLATQLLKAGYYLSFGKHLLQPAAAAVFQSTPVNRLFLETDAAAISIETIYEAAAAIKKCTVTELAKQVGANATELFGINFN